MKKNIKRVYITLALLLLLILACVYVYFFGFGKKMISFHEVNKNKDDIPFDVFLTAADENHATWEFTEKEGKLFEISYGEEFFIYEKKTYGWFPVDDKLSIDVNSIESVLQGKTVSFTQEWKSQYGDLKKGKYLLYKEFKVKNRKGYEKYKAYLRFDIE